MGRRFHGVAFIRSFRLRRGSLGNAGFPCDPPYHPKPSAAQRKHPGEARRTKPSIATLECNQCVTSDRNREGDPRVRAHPSYRGKAPRNRSAGFDAAAAAPLLPPAIVHSACRADLAPSTEIFCPPVTAPLVRRAIPAARRTARFGNPAHAGAFPNIHDAVTSRRETSMGAPLSICSSPIAPSRVPTGSHRFLVSPAGIPPPRCPAR